MSKIRDRTQSIGAAEVAGDDAQHGRHRAADDAPRTMPIEQAVAAPVEEPGEDVAALVVGAEEVVA